MFGKKSLKILSVILTILLTLSAVACSNEQKNVSLNNTSDKEIVLAGYRNLAPGNEDGYYCSKILYVWEPLITQDENANPIPALAESWEMSADAKEWTFKLREDVKFHNGDILNSDVIIKNFDRMKLEVKKSSFYPLDINAHYPNLEKYEKVDDYRFKLVFSEPMPTLLYNMVNFGSPVYNPSNFTENGDFNGLLIGTGPFKLIENVLDEYLVLERNEEYYGEKAQASKIKIKVIPDADTRYSALKSGEIQGVIDLNAIPASLAYEASKDDSLEISTSKSTMIRFLVLNGTKAPFNDIRMKQAVSMILKRKQLTDDIYFGFASPTTNILNYSTPFYKDIPVLENMEEAKALAKEVLGDSRVEVKYLYNSKEPAQKSEAELITSWLKEIGIDCILEPMEMKNMKEVLKSGDFGIARMQQGLSNAEASTIFRRFMLTSGDHNQNYSLGYQSDIVDELMKEAMESADVNRRKEIYNQIQEISVKDLPVVPLFNDMTVVAYSKDLKGYDAKLYGIDLPAISWK